MNFIFPMGTYNSNEEQDKELIIISSFFLASLAKTQRYSTLMVVAGKSLKLFRYGFAFMNL
jgi:hypothetical protein